MINEKRSTASYFLNHNALGRTRTGTVSLPGDFESPTSTNFITRALNHFIQKIITCLEHFLYLLAQSGIFVDNSGIFLYPLPLKTWIKGEFIKIHLHITYDRPHTSPLFLNGRLYLQPNNPSL